MDMFIEIKDGKVHNHPILVDNLIQLGFNLNELPNNFVKFVRDDYSMSAANLKAGQWFEYFTEYNAELQIVFEYAVISGEPILDDPNHLPPALQSL